jgi:transposase InsO family protein
MRVSGSESPNRTNEEEPIQREPGRGHRQGGRWRPEGRRSMPQALQMRDGMKGASPAMSLRSVASRPTATGRADTGAWASPNSSASGNSKANTPGSSGCMPFLRWRTTRSRNSSKKNSDACRPPRGGRLAHCGTEPSRVAGVPAGERQPHHRVSTVPAPRRPGRRGHRATQRGCRQARLLGGLEVLPLAAPEGQLPERIRQPLDVPAEPHRMWAMDFMHDTLFCGKRFRTLNIIDEGAREALAIEVDSSLSAERDVRVLDQNGESRPLPDQSRIANGPELYSAKVVAWAEAHSVRLHCIQPGKPTQNAYIVRFNRTSGRRSLMRTCSTSSVKSARSSTNG